MKLKCPTCGSDNPGTCLLGGGPHSHEPPNDDFACCPDPFHEQAMTEAAA